MVNSNSDVPPTPASHPPPEEEEIHLADGRIEHPAVRTEHTDVRFRTVLISVLATMGSAAFIFWVILAFYHHYEGYQAEIKKSPFPLAPTPSQALPQEPRLEPIDRMADIQKPNVFARELAKEKTLNSYGPTEQKGYVHIPIDQAIDRLAGKLSERKKSPPSQDKANGLVDSGESNSGRMLRREPR